MTRKRRSAFGPTYEPTAFVDGAVAPPEKV
jgi:hypothetical protein